MRFPFWAVLLNLAAAAVTLPRADGQQQPSLDPGPGKAYYTIIPKPGVDPADTEAFVKTTTGADDLLPWTDTQDNLVSWTAAATPEQAELLRGYEGVDKVEELVLPPAPGGVAE